MWEIQRLVRKEDKEEFTCRELEITWYFSRDSSENLSLNLLSKYTSHPFLFHFLSFLVLSWFNQVFFTYYIYPFWLSSFLLVYLGFICFDPKELPLVSLSAKSLTVNFLSFVFFRKWLKLSFVLIFKISHLIEVQLTCKNCSYLRNMSSLNEFGEKFTPRKP